MIKVSVIGIAGIPACYGGFETLVEHLVDYCPSNIEYTVFCSTKMYVKSKRVRNYKNAKLFYLSLSANGVTSIIYDLICMNKSLKADVMLILGVSGCIFLPVIRKFYKGRIITNIDGLEWKRAKWGKLTKWFLLLSEKEAVKYSDVIIGDNKGITDYVKKSYMKDAVLIEYGADHCTNVINEGLYKTYPFCKQPYAISVCRIEPENNIDFILKAFSKSPTKNLILVGNWSKSEYGVKLREEYKMFPNIFLLDPIYDQNIINWLRTNAKIYIHGHSAGGTNPSLVEAMNLGLPILAYDCIYNRETTENNCCYWTNDITLLSLLEKNSNEITMIGKKMKQIAKTRYVWKLIAEKYNNLYTN